MAARRNKTRGERMADAINAPVELDTTVKIKIKRSNQIDDKKYKCSCCGASWDSPKSHFSKSASVLYQANDGYINICNSCRDMYYYQLVDLYNGNEAHAIKHFCQQFDIIFHEDALTASRQISADRSRISHYQAKKNLGQTARVGSTYIDGMKADFENKQKENRESIIETLDDLDSDKKTKQKTVKFFGTGFSDDDYQYLQDQYTDWTTRCECKTKAQEEVFKRICFKQLEILKANRAGLDTKDLDKTFQDYLDTANLKPKQNNLDALSDAQTFGTLLAKWENEKPLPEIDEELQDVDKIGLYIDVFFRGHLAKMMGLKNGLSNLYNKFIKKYTVEKPEYEGDEDNEALFDAIFGGGHDE